MIIKSPFKDYYDYVANQYGGGDPKIVYPRTRISEHNIAIELVLESTTPKSVSPVMSYASASFPLRGFNRGLWNSRAEKRVAYLIIAGKVYLISRPITDLSDNVNGYKLEPLIDPEDEKRPYWSRWRPRDIEFGKEYPGIVALCQKVGHPVFVVFDVEYGWRSGSDTKVIVSGQCPILQHIGLPSLIPATQMYQELSYFMGNLMKPSPDVKPPVELSNRQRIVKAGFDLVKSFRHRT